MPTPSDYVIPAIDQQDAIIDIPSFDAEAGRVKASHKFRKTSKKSLVTFRERLGDCDWDTALPHPDKLLPYITKSVVDQSRHIDIIKNTVSLLASLLFVALFSIELTRFIYYISDDELREKNHITNHMRSFIRAIGFVVAFILNINNSITGLWKLHFGYRRNKKSITKISDDYKEVRNEIIQGHHLQYAFFSILELISLLKKLTLTHNYLQEISNLEQNLKSIFKMSHLNKNAKDYTRENNILLAPLQIITKLKKLLLSQPFKAVTDKIRLSVSKNFDHILHINLANASMLKFREDFCDITSRNEQVLMDILDIIAAVASREHYEKSRHYKLMDLTKIRVSTHLKEILINYWNDDKTGALIEPSVIDFDALAIKVNNKIREDYPHYMFNIPGAPSLPPPPSGVLVGPSSVGAATAQPILRVYPYEHSGVQIQTGFMPEGYYPNPITPL